MATNFFITHDDGTLSDYDATTIANSGSLSVSAAAAMGGTAFGLQCTVTGSADRAFGYLNYSSFTGTQYVISFWFDKQTVNIPAGDVTILRLRKPNYAAGTGMLLVEVVGSSSIKASIRDDGGTLRGSSNVSISSGPVFIEIIITKASSAVANDGIMEIKIDSVSKYSRSDLDLFNVFSDADRVEVGFDDVDAGGSGTSYWDQIRGGDPDATPGILRTPGNYIADQGIGAAGGEGGSIGGSAGGSGSGGNAAIDASGLHIYLAAFNDNNNPILIKILALLTNDGSIVFEPDTGSRISVQTSKLTNGHVWVAGVFDGNTVAKSEDGGSTFETKDDGTFGTIRSFIVGPDNDDRILLFDGDNGDLIESLDGGETWTIINSAVPVLINSIGRLNINPDELVIGNQGDVSNSINYSPNSGVDLEDYQTGVYPNADNTVVVSTQD